jgi:hypothetical protein
MNEIQKQVLEKAYEVEFESDGSDMICLAVIMYLEDNVKLSTKATTLDEFQKEILISYNKSKQELLEQFQYDVYVMKKYPKRIRDIISVTGYANHLSEDEDYQLNLDIINEIDMNIIDSYPDKRLKNQYDYNREVMHESWCTIKFIYDQLMEIKQ